VTFCDLLQLNPQFALQIAGLAKQINWYTTTIMAQHRFTTTGIIKQFPQVGGWVYLPITQTYRDLSYTTPPKWGLVPATITIGDTTWQRSLLPFGDGSLFIALNAKVRRAENLSVGDTITATFRL
jgi:hypothetical protein